MRILVVDDDATQANLLAGALAAEGHAARDFSSPKQALSFLTEEGADLLLTDFRMPEMNGLELIREALRVDPGLTAIIITAYGTVETAVTAMKEGAFDYLTKPVDLDHLLVLVDKAEKQRELIRENRTLRENLSRANQVKGLIGESRAMQMVASRIARVAGTDATVLLLGESGTGKELAARAIHSLGPRHDRPFVAVNCAALPETLLESELFGHARGAFSGASTARTGKFEAARDGTLFLDEIGEVPPPVQVKLLRFLQERTLERLGENQVRHVDVRLLAATNKSLEEAVEKGEFREDLYYRLNVVPIHLPPLRDRKGDIEILAAHFQKKFARAHSRPVTGYTPRVHDILMRHSYPGNVRELENILENAVVMCRSDTLAVDDLPPYLARAAENGEEKGEPSSLNEALDQVERSMILRALEKAGHVQTRAAEILGISERVLRYKMKKWGLQKG